MARPTVLAAALLLLLPLQAKAQAPLPDAAGNESTEGNATSEVPSPSPLNVVNETPGALGNVSSDNASSGNVGSPELGPASTSTTTWTVPGGPGGWWVLGALDQNCNDACLAAGHICVDENLPVVDNEASVRMVAELLGHPCVGAVGYIVDKSPLIVGDTCYWASGGSTVCEGESPSWERMCWCTATTTMTTSTPGPGEPRWVISEFGASCNDACSSVPGDYMCPSALEWPSYSLADTMAMMGSPCEGGERGIGASSHGYLPAQHRNGRCSAQQSRGRTQCGETEADRKRLCRCIAAPPVPVGPANGTWVYGSQGADCHVTCQSQELVCNDDFAFAVNEYSEVQAIARSLGVDCASFSSGSTWRAPSVRGTICYKDSRPTLCSATEWAAMRFCYCTAPEPFSTTTTTSATLSTTTFTYVPGEPRWVLGAEGQSCNAACGGVPEEGFVCAPPPSWPRLSTGDMELEVQKLGKTCATSRALGGNYRPSIDLSSGECVAADTPTYITCQEEYPGASRLCYCAVIGEPPVLGDGQWAMSAERGTCDDACSNIGFVCGDGPRIVTGDHIQSLAHSFGLTCTGYTDRAYGEGPFVSNSAAIYCYYDSATEAPPACSRTTGGQRFCWCKATTTTTRDPFAPVPAPQPQWVLGKLGTSCTFECQQFGNYWWNEAWSCVPGDFPRLSSNADLEALAVTLGVECGRTGNGGNADAHSISPSNYCIRNTHSRGIDCDASGAYAIRMCWCTAPPTPAPPTPPTPQPTPYVYVTRGPTQSPYTSRPTQTPYTNSPTQSPEAATSGPTQTPYSNRPTQSPAAATSGPTQSPVVGASPAGAPTSSPPAGAPTSSPPAGVPISSPPAGASPPASAPIGDSGNPMPAGSSPPSPAAVVPTEPPVANKRGVRVAFSWAGLDCGRLTAQGSSTRANFIQAIEEGILEGLKNPKVTRAHIITKLFCSRRLQAASTASGSVKSESTIDAENAQVPTSELQAAVTQAKSAVTMAVQSKARSAGGIADVTITGELPTIGNFQSEQVDRIPTSCDVDVCVSIEDSGVPRVWLSGVVAAVACTALTI